MVELTPTAPSPFDALASFDLAGIDTKVGTSHTHSTHAVTAAKEDDTVTLSASAQANQLYLQGNSISQIATLLGLPAATVDSDLNISQNTSTTVPAVARTTGFAPALPLTTTTATSAPYTAPAIIEAKVA